MMAGNIQWEAPIPNFLTGGHHDGGRADTLA